jgi:hypothetical protein
LESDYTFLGGKWALIKMNQDQEGATVSEQAGPIQWRTVTGEPVTLGDLIVTPEAQTLTVQLPSGGLVWNRPSAVLIEQGDGIARLPVIDITRLAQVALWSLSLCFMVVALIGFSGQRRSKHG